MKFGSASLTIEKKIQTLLSVEGEILGVDVDLTQFATVFN